MRVTVRLFAAVRDKIGREQISVELCDDATVGNLRQFLGEHYPELQTLLPHVLFAVEDQYANEDAPLTENCEIACIPPVSGG